MSKMNENELRRRLDLLSEIKPSPQAAGQALDRVRQTLTQTDQQPDARPVSFWRTIMASKLTKPVIAAAALLAIVILWQSMTFTGNAYALSDVPHLLEQAKTIHVRMRHFSGGREFPAEYWYDPASGRMYRSLKRPTTEQGPDGLQSVTEVTRTVWDGQYVMEVNDRTKTVGFQRLLTSQQQLNRILIAEFGLKIALQDIANLDKYTRIGNEEIGGESYDIWRREFKMVPTPQVRYRSDYWVSPATGKVGRVRRWIKTDADWILTGEMDAVQIDVEPPAGLFSTEPPAGYTLKNEKHVAEYTGIGLTAYESEGCSLRAPVSLGLEDGSVLVCWRTTGGPAVPDPNAPYENLSFGGDLAQTPMRVFGLISATDENHTEPVLHYVGRHVAVTRNAGTVYEWALYVPPRTVVATERTVLTITAIQPKVQMSGDLRTEHRSLIGFASLCITREDFEQYVPTAARELSDNQAVPAELTYDGLQALAQRVRATPELYEAVRTWAEGPQSRMLKAEPVETTTPEQVRQKAKQLAEAFFAAIVDGRDTDAMNMLEYEEPRASRVVTGMKQLPGVKDIKVESIYSTEENALVLTNEFPAYEGRSGRWAIGIRKEKGTWRIGDFDATTTEKMQEEIDDYLKHFPNAKHFP
ncbi:MAG: hypothetical protein ABFD90_15440 [Phycisphaerales bacterium]